MNDFSFSKVFRTAFNTLIKNFTDVFVLSVLAISSILVMSLFLNSVFLGRVSAIMSTAIIENVVQSAAQSAPLANPLFLFSVYIGCILVFSALILFCLFCAFLPLCKGAALKLKNVLPSLQTSIRFTFSALILFMILEIILVAFPLVAKAVSDGDGYTAGVFVVSAVSFALITGFVIFALRYALFFLPLLENVGLKESLAKSYLITNHRRMKIFILFAVLFLINYVAKYFLFLLLVTVPFSVLAVIYAYLELSGEEIGSNAVAKI